VIVSDVLKVVGAFLPYQESDGEGFDGRVAPAIVVDTACMIDVVNVVAVLSRPPYFEVRHFEVVVENLSLCPAELGHDVVLSRVVGDGRPQSMDAPVVKDYRVAILDTTVAHESEDVVADSSEDEGVVVQSPEVLQADEDRLLVQKLGLETRHMTIANILIAHFFWHS